MSTNCKPKSRSSLLVLLIIAVTMASSVNHVPLWERCKENAAPLERGRNVAVLEESFQTAAGDKQATIQHYERIVQPYERNNNELSDSDDDPLIHWLSYIKFYQESFPSDKKDQFKLVERCFRSMSRHVKYKDDVRFIRVCCMYAEMTNDRTMEIFTHCYKERIGVKVSIFWAAWAWKAEMDENFQLTDEIFNKGIYKYQARPLEFLKTRYKQFQRRFAKHMARQAEDEGLEREEYEQGTRGALGGLTHHAVRRNDRSQAIFVPRAATGRTESRVPGTATYRERRTTSSRDNEENVPSGTTGGFAIFAEERHTHGISILDDSFAVDASRRDHVLETDQEVRKENTLAAEPWNDRGGLYNEYTGSAAAPTTPSIQQALSFSVHVDEECIAQHEREEAARRAQEQQMRRHRDERLFQDREDGGVAEILASDPLRYTRDPSLIDSDMSRRVVETKRPLANKLVERSESQLKQQATSAFDKKLLYNPLGVEQCFEEARARALYYNLATPAGNFNLFRDDNTTSDSQCMDSDNDVSMEDDSVDQQSLVVLTHPPRQPFAPRQTQPSEATSLDGPSRSMLAMEDSRPPLSGRAHLSLSTSAQSFHDVNRSLDQNTPRNASFQSTASSTVDEAIAVSAPRGKEDQTINTALALKELSMMFGSPALPPVAEGPPTRLGEFSISDALGDLEPNASFTRGGSDDERESSKREQQADTTTFQIFCDDNEKKNTQLPRCPDFNIYKDDSATGEVCVATKNSSSEGAVSFSVFQDTDDQNDSTKVSQHGTGKYDADETVSLAELASVLKVQGNGARSPRDSGLQRAGPSSYDETATLSEINAILGLAGPHHGIRSSPDTAGMTAQLADIKNALGSIQKGNGRIESIAELDDETVSLAEIESILGKKDDDTIGITRNMTTTRKGHLSNIQEDEEDETVGLPAMFCTNNGGDTFQGFGDVSGIAFEDEPTLTMQVAMAMKRSVDYTKVYDAETKTASMQLLARGQGHLPVGDSLTEVFATEGLVCSCPTDVIPRAFKLSSLAANTEIKIGRKTSVVMRELGRGAFGTVALVKTNDSKKMLAVKVQRPASCLALEFETLRKLADRLCPRDPSLIGKCFPNALAYISVADGAMMSMTAGSMSGVNLVDLVNLYKDGLGCNVPGIVALHYTARMLHHLEMLHWHGQILHCDTKPDNWVLCSSDTLTRGSPINGSEVMMVDFGRAIDLVAAAKSADTAPMEALLTGEASPKPMQCVSMRNGLPWSFDIDTFGVCAAAHVLLFGQHMEITMDPKGRRWVPVESFDHNNQRALWITIFDSLLNLDDVSRSAISSHPKSVRHLRTQIETFLSTRQEKLVTALRSQAQLLEPGVN